MENCEYNFHFLINLLFSVSMQIGYLCNVLCSMVLFGFIGFASFVSAML
jgi:hypothetical protein